MLGFMITVNPKDPDEKAKGMKDVCFVMMVTDDALQDEHEVACAKAVLHAVQSVPAGAHHKSSVCFGWRWVLQKQVPSSFSDFLENLDRDR
jgi:hypothetical protein